MGLLSAFLQSLLPNVEPETYHKASGPDGQSIVYWSDGKQTIHEPATNETATSYDRTTIEIRSGSHIVRNRRYEK